MNLTNETFRKLAHLSLIIIPIIYYQLGKWGSLKILIPIAILVIFLDYLRCKNKKAGTLLNKVFAPILREKEIEEQKLSGASFVALATFITFSFFKQEIAITAFMILIFADAAAAIIGKAFPSQPFFEKSLSGAIGFFVIGLIVLFSCGSFFNSGIWFYLIGLFALTCVTIIESRPSLLKIDDNFTIPVAFAIIMTFFDLVWNYTY